MKKIPNILILVSLLIAVVVLSRLAGYVVFPWVWILFVTWIAFFVSLLIAIVIVVGFLVKERKCFEPEIYEMLKKSFVDKK